MNIAFLLEDTNMSDELRATLALADAMTVRGHVVRIVTTDSAPTWRSSRAEWVFVEELARYVPDEDEFVIATSRATADIAQRTASRRSALYAFVGDEGAGIPILAASPGMKGTFIGAVVDDDIYRKGALREHEPLRVLLNGPSQNEALGIGDGYGAVAHARWFHQTVDLVRVSPWAPSRDEPLDSVQEFHVALSDAETARLLHSCDVAVVPHESDAFSLVAMQALAAGIPAVFTNAVPSFDTNHDYALFAPAGNAIEIGERLIELLESPETRVRLSERGREAAEDWRASKVAARLEKYLSQFDSPQSHRDPQRSPS
jgi:hypothetical protein